MINQSPTINAVEKNAPLTGAVRALFMGLLLVGSVAFAGEPSPGVDIYLGKNPGGRITTVGASDAKGQFVVVVKEPGQYRVSTSLRPGLPRRPYQLSLKATGATLKESGLMTYDFTVGREPVTLRGMVSENDSPRPTNR